MLLQILQRAFYRTPSRAASILVNTTRYIHNLMRPYFFVITEPIESITQVLLFIIIYSSTHLFSNSE